MNNTQILLRNNFISMKSGLLNPLVTNSLSVCVATVVSNLAYYGYVPSMELLQSFQLLSDEQLGDFWKSFEPEIKEVTGANKEMERFVVYKNFPQEVLAKTEMQYWCAQILMYWGVPNDYFVEDAVERPKLSENKSLKVLSLAKDDTLQILFNNLVLNPSRWTDVQKEMVFHLFDQVSDRSVDISCAKFKENVIELAKRAINSMKVEDYSALIKVTTATDVLRLASGMSDADISLRVAPKFKQFKRSERRFLLGLLECSTNLLNDAIARPEMFKKLFRSLRPGDYNFKNVSEVYNKLYKKDYVTFNAKMVKSIKEKDVLGLELLKSRPGELFRSFHHMYSVYGTKAIDAFVCVVPLLTTLQLLKMSKYLETINGRKQLMFAPKGDWTLVHVEENKKVYFLDKYKAVVLNEIANELKARLSIQIPEGVLLDNKTADIKLQTNDQELASYGRGTVFDIPENIKFIRSASYWSIESNHNVWFDNGWNFFSKEWKSVDTCCWSSYTAAKGGAIFSGDPTNSKDIAGRACQMIDLYLDKLQSAGICYAVWNILAYSRIPFESADVLATLQYGENPEHGKLYEPSRAQMVFPLKGKNLSKYVAYIDVVNRKLVYMDANFYGHVNSAVSNGLILSEKMPAFVEYLDSLPSVYDLFKHAPKGDIPVLYSDKDIEINTKEAFVFNKENPKNQCKDYNINTLLAEKSVVNHRDLEDC